MSLANNDNSNDSWLASRRLLKRLREVMASVESTQSKLNRVVTLIAQDMVAEVCSIYIRKPGEVLELFATQGLKAEAIHKTRLYIGEGLVGDIAAHARPLSLSDAQHHPNFAYRPETGEEIYHSLLGVPILRDDKVIGVLVVQNRSERIYHDEEIEVLETVAMVLAELAAAARLIGLAENDSEVSVGQTTLRLVGAKLNGGLGMGKAMLHTRMILGSQIIADNIDVELARFETALEAMQGALDGLVSHPGSKHHEYQDILETYRMFAQDSGWARKIAEAVRTGLTAEAATIRVLNEMRARFGQMSDPYLRERVHDMEDLSNRLLQHMSQKRRPVPKDQDMILVARTLGPMELLDYQHHHLKGVVLEEGSASAHVAIIARALNIPMIGQVSDLMANIEAFDTLIIDGDHGQVHIRPSDDVQASYQETIASRTARQQFYLSQKDLPFVSLDNVPVSVNINGGFTTDVDYIHQVGADGIGLYRTEIPFMLSAHFPSLDEQVTFYRDVLDAARDKPVVFRTLDIGADKTLPYMPLPGDEENPAMGWRAIRISLDRPALFRVQLRAMLLAAGGRNLHLMFPMVATVAEFLAAKRLLLKEQALLVQEGKPVPSVLKVGSMLEVPSLLWQLPELFAHVDFLSVGSNDLLQFVFAIDRGSALVGNRYDTLSPAVLNLLASISRGCEKACVPLTICGEMAGTPLEAMVLIGLGFRRLSMNPFAVGAVRAMLRSLHVGDLTQFLDRIRTSDSASVREQIRHYARDHGVVV